jgi:hypothetical protein
MQLQTFWDRSLISYTIAWQSTCTQLPSTITHFCLHSYVSSNISLIFYSAIPKITWMSAALNIKCSGMWCCVIAHAAFDILEKCTVFILRAQGQAVFLDCFTSTTKGLWSLTYRVSHPRSESSATPLSKAHPSCSLLIECAWISRLAVTKTTVTYFRDHKLNIRLIQTQSWSLPATLRNKLLFTSIPRAAFWYNILAELNLQIPHCGNNKPNFKFYLFSLSAIVSSYCLVSWNFLSCQTQTVACSMSVTHPPDSSIIIKVHNFIFIRR